MSKLIVHKSGNPEYPAIVFLHGASVSSWMWDEQVKHLQDAYYCLAIDLPGSGESYQIPWLSLTESASLVADVIRAEVPGQKAHIVGLSLGGYVAVRLLENHPEQLLSVIASGITARPFSTQWLIRCMLFVMSRISRWDIMIRMNSKMMNIPEYALELYRRDCKNMPPDMLSRIFREVLPFQLTKLEDVRTRPFLAVAGEKEAALILQSLEDFPRCIEGAVAALVPGGSHFWSAEKSELFSEMIRSWIQSKTLPEGIQVQEPVEKESLRVSVA